MVALCIVLVAAIVLCGIYYYNEYSLLIVKLDKQLSLVDIEIQRRASLIPNLLVISAEYGAHEKMLYKYVSEMRNQLVALEGMAPKTDSNPLENVLSNLLAIAEQYPDLKATQSFEKLRQEWSETENRIAECRGEFMETIREYNGLCTTFPSNVYGRLFGRYKRERYVYEDPSWSARNLNKFYLNFLQERADGTSLAEKTGLANANSELTEFSRLRELTDSTVNSTGEMLPEAGQLEP